VIVCCCEEGEEKELEVLEVKDLVVEVRGNSTRERWGNVKEGLR